MPIPLDHWLFAIKTYAAALLALGVAFWLDLPRPYWALASVYIASQPLAGATYSKAFFRAAGTVAGAAVAVLLVPNLVNAPPLLALAIALWSGLCLYLSIIDRAPRGYAFMLAGYTTALIGFPAVDAPGAIFDLALSRGEEILVGIFSAALVSGVLFPRNVGPAAAGRVARWLDDAATAARDALHPARTGDSRKHWRRLAADTAEIENLAAHLPFEAGADRRALTRFRRLLPRMLMTLPEISAIADVRSEIDALGGPSPRAAALVAFAGDALARGDLFALVREVEAAEIEAHMERPGSGWKAFLEFTLLARLRDLSALLADCRRLESALARGAASLPAPLAFPLDAGAMRARHDDHPAALAASLTLMTALLLCCAFWIGAAWPDGAAAAMMTAVAASLFATQDDPLPSLRKFAMGSALAVGVSGLYVLFILPRVHGFETLALALAPALLAFGLLIAHPRSYLIGLALGVLAPSSMALQRAYDANAEAFVNAGLALFAGVAVAVAATALRRAGGGWRAARVVRANESALAEVADIRGGPRDALALALMFDRLSLLAPIAQADDARTPDAMRQLRAGLNLVEARKARSALSARGRRRLDAALMRVARAYGRHAPQDDETLAALDRAMRGLRPQAAADRPALLALAGLRRCLFPRAPLAPLLESAA